MNRVEFPLVEPIDMVQIAAILNRSMWCARSAMEVEVSADGFRMFYFDFAEAEDAIHFKMRWS